MLEAFVLVSLPLLDLRHYDPYLSGILRNVGLNTLFAAYIMWVVTFRSGSVVLRGFGFLVAPLVRLK